MAKILHLNFTPRHHNSPTPVSTDQITPNAGNDNISLLALHMWNLESSSYLLDVMYQMFLHCTRNRDDVHLYRSAIDLLTERPHCNDLVSLLMQNDRNTIIRVSSQKFYGTEKVAEYPIYVITVFPYMGFINGRWFDVPDTKRTRQAFANYCVQIFNVYVAPHINSPRKRIVLPPPSPSEDVVEMQLEETKKTSPVEERPKTFLQKLKYCFTKQ